MKVLKELGINVQMHARSGRYGEGWLPDPMTFAWKHAGDDHVVAATFRVIVHCQELERYSLDEAGWKRLQQSGQDGEAILFWVRRGCALEQAILATMSGVMPEVFRTSPAQRVQELERRCAELQAQAEQLKNASESNRNRKSSLTKEHHRYKVALQTIIAKDERSGLFAAIAREALGE